jgi:hypothetical protein
MQLEWQNDEWVDLATEQRNLRQNNRAGFVEFKKIRLTERPSSLCLIFITRLAIIVINSP